MRTLLLGCALSSAVVACGGAAPSAPLVGPVSSAQPQAGPALPATRPADFALSYSVEDGSGAKATNLSCDASGCVMTQLANGELDTAKTEVSPAQLDAVYKAVVDEHFNEVTSAATPPAPAPDATTTTLWVKAADYYGSAHRSNEDQAKADKRFDALRAAVLAVAAEVHLDLDKPLPGVLPKTPTKRN